MVVGAGGYFFNNTAVYGVLDTRTALGDIWSEMDPLAVSLLGFGTPIVLESTLALCLGAERTITWDFRATTRLM